MSLVTVNTPSFAVGSPYVPNDMLANIHQGEIIMDRSSSDVLRRYGIPASGSADNRAMVAELKELRREVAQLRAENKSGQFAIAKNTGKSARVAEKWDVDGLPDYRDGSAVLAA